MVLVGYLDRKAVYATEELIAQLGIDKIRYELIGRVLISRGINPFMKSC